MIAQSLELDKTYVIHPYTSMTNPIPCYLVERADGVYIQLKSGEKLIDGMSSWWSVIHGYNHPEMNKAGTDQINTVSHVMFGGLTHEPAINLAKKLVDISPDGLEKVFFSDSGSVSVEVAIKMALQYWNAQNKPSKNKIVSLKKGYHGDTFMAMSVCDSETGMHTAFNGVVRKQIMVEAPQVKYHEDWDERDLNHITSQVEANHDKIAAVILEPIVQGAGGMRFYHPKFLKGVRNLCDKYNILLIADEIATGFGRTGELFACNHANITPDILCLGKALTGGYMTFAATLTTQKVAQTISNGNPGIFMHGPTFMGNPLACSFANKSIELLLSTDWKANIQRLEKGLNKGLLPIQDLKGVKDVRVIGAIGVVEMKTAVDLPSIQKSFIEQGVWLRPFGKLIYIMPPYIITDEQLSQLTSAMHHVIARL